MGTTTGPDGLQNAGGVPVKPLAIDLYAGLGGWSDGCIAEGFDVVGFDIERHEYGEHRYPGQLRTCFRCTEASLKPLRS